MTSGSPSPIREHVGPWLEALPSCLLVVASTGTIRFANGRARDALASVLANAGVDAADLEGTALDDVLGPVSLLQEAMTQDGRMVVDVVDGAGPRQLGLSVSKTDMDPCAGCWMVVFRDISDEITTRKERDRLLRLAAVAETMPSLLHEVKNPLASVTTLVELAVEEVAAGETEALAKDLHTVLTELRRTKLTLEGVGLVGRDLSSDGHHAVDFAITEACRVFEKRAESAGMAVKVDVDAMPLLPFDLSSTRAIVFNLLNNAFQACPAGTEVRVRARLVDDGSTLQVDVDDDGPGMSAETLRRCRQLFFSTKRGGSGIGLSLVDRMVRDVGGALRIDSDDGEGCRIRIRVPTVPITSTTVRRKADIHPPSIAAAAAVATS